MDAEHLIRAQSEAVGAACAGLASIYRARTEHGVQAWLDTAATELWLFARDRRLVAPPVAAWVTVLDEHPRAPSASLGVGFSAGLTPGQKHSASIGVQRLVGFACPTPTPDESTVEPPPGDDPAVNGVMHKRVIDRGDGAALVLAGLLRPDGHIDESAADDELLTAFFNAVATAVADRVMGPISTQRSLRRRLTSAQWRVLELLSEGMSTQEIADRLERSPHTVHDHMMSVYRALGVNSRHDAQEVWCGRRPLTVPTPDDRAETAPRALRTGTERTLR